MNKFATASCRLALSTLVVFTGPELCFSSSGAEIWVSPQGDDGNAGTREAPLETLAAARDAVRTMDRPAGGITVFLRAGTYHLSETLTLDSRDSGTEACPITYRSYPGESVRVSGGEAIDAGLFMPVSDPALAARLTATAREHVLVADLSETDLGAYFPGKGDYGLLGWGEHVLQLAQWPNRGYHHMKEVIDKGPTTRWLKPGEEPAPYSEEHPTGGKFTILEPMQARAIEAEFDRTGDMMAIGYPHNDWYYQTERVGDVEDGVIQLLRYTTYGIVAAETKIPRRVKLVNVLCELDEPGEWYYDRNEGKLFVWPVDPITPSTSISVLGGPSLISATDCSYLTFQGLTLENAGETAIAITGGEHNLIAGCTIRNCLKRGAVLAGTANSGITGCDFYGLHSAFSISGGDTRTLTAGNNHAVNNHIHHCRLRGYGMIGLSGVGIRFANNLLHDMNGAISYNANELDIEYNEFYNMGFEMGDWNVAYTGAKWWNYGCRVRYNFVHHLMELPKAWDVVAFRNDDGGQGVSFDNNFFYKAGRGAVAFAGAGNTLRNNVVMETHIVWQTNRGATTPEEVQAKWDGLADFGVTRRQGDKGDYLYRTERAIGEKGWAREPWKSAYPTFNKVMESGNPWTSSYAQVKNNYGWHLRTPIYVHGATTDDLVATCDWEMPVEFDPQEVFVDPDNMDFTFRDSVEPIEGFDRADFDRIGLYEDEYRPYPPDKSKYRIAIRKKYEGLLSSYDWIEGPGSEYDTETVNERFTAPPYLSE